MQPNPADGKRYQGVLETQQPLWKTVGPSREGAAFQGWCEGSAGQRGAWCPPEAQGSVHTDLPGHLQPGLGLVLALELCKAGAAFLLEFHLSNVFSASFGFS